MLNGIHLIDFANHRDTRLTFGRMTALVGQNGSGKTNTMNAILQVADRYHDFFQLNDDDQTTRVGALEWMIAASWNKEFEGKEGELALLTTPTERKWLWKAITGKAGKTWIPDPSAEMGTAKIDPYTNFDFKKLRAEIAKPAEPAQPDDPIGLAGFKPAKDTWSSQYFKTAGNYLRRPSYSEKSPPKLQGDCRDLAWVISYLKGDKDEAFAEIINALKTVVPVVRRVRHRPVPVVRVEQKEAIINKQSQTYNEKQQVMGQELRFDMASGEDLPASAISEGTLVTLAILTAIIQDGNNRGSQTILLDDIESGLHPKAQRDLVKQLRRLQEARPELQIIFSSHSPYIIDEMKAEDVWLFATDKEGCSRSAKLSEHPDAKRAMEVLTTGEFWSAEGEDWVLDPNHRQPQELQPTA